MKNRKILYVSSEVVPYLPENEISSMSFEIPKMVNKQGGQIRIFMPKYGNINESLEFQKVSKPTIGTKQILIKTKAASYNPLDYKIIRGDFKSVRKIEFPKGRDPYANPIRPFRALDSAITMKR